MGYRNPRANIEHTSGGRIDTEVQCNAGGGAGIGALGGMARDERIGMSGSLTGGADQRGQGGACVGGSTGGELEHGSTLLGGRAARCRRAAWSGADVADHWRDEPLPYPLAKAAAANTTAWVSNVQEHAPCLPRQFPLSRLPRCVTARSVPLPRLTEEQLLLVAANGSQWFVVDMLDSAGIKRVQQQSEEQVLQQCLGRLSSAQAPASGACLRDRVRASGRRARDGYR